MNHSITRGNHHSRQILLEPLDALLLSIIHGLLVLVTAPIAAQGKTVDLLVVDLDLGGDAGLVQGVSDLLDRLQIQQAVLLAHGDAGRFRDGGEVGGDGE